MMLHFMLLFVLLLFLHECYRVFSYRTVFSCVLYNPVTGDVIDSSLASPNDLVMVSFFVSDKSGTKIPLFNSYSKDKHVKDVRQDEILWTGCSFPAQNTGYKDYIQLWLRPAILKDGTSCMAVIGVLNNDTTRYIDYIYKTE